MAEEQALDPERKIIDPHLHFWDPQGGGRFFVPKQLR